MNAEIYAGCFCGVMREVAPGNCGTYCCELSYFIVVVVVVLLLIIIIIIIILAPNVVLNTRSRLLCLFKTVKLIPR